MHTHIYRPAQADPVRSRIKLRCGCWRAAVACEPCTERLEAHRVALQASFKGEGEHPGDRPEPGCEAKGCYRGLVMVRQEKACCCSRAQSEAERCRGCRSMPRGIHNCEFASEAEINHELALRMMPKPQTAKPTKEARAMSAAMEQATQLRAPPLHDRK